jgi:hypothetical protein
MVRGEMYQTPVVFTADGRADEWLNYRAKLQCPPQEQEDHGADVQLGYLVLVPVSAAPIRSQSPYARSEQSLAFPFSTLSQLSY